MPLLGWTMSFLLQPWRLLSLDTAGLIFKALMTALCLLQAPTSLLSPLSNWRSSGEDRSPTWRLLGILALILLWTSPSRCQDAFWMIMLHCWIDVHFLFEFYSTFYFIPVWCQHCANSEDSEVTVTDLREFAGLGAGRPWGCAGGMDKTAGGQRRQA